MVSTGHGAMVHVQCTRETACCADDNTFIVTSFSGDMVVRTVVVLKLTGCKLDWFLGCTTMLLTLNDYTSKEISHKVVLEFFFLKLLA